MTALQQAIETHRELYRSDLFIDRMVARQPPTSLDLNTGVLHQEPAAAIGMTVSGRLLRYVSHPEGYGADFPWSKAFWHLKNWCRKEHYTHRGPDRTYWRGSLCYEAVKLVVIGGRTLAHGPLSPEQACQILRVDELDDVLTKAFGFIEDRMDAFRVEAELRAKEDEGVALTCVCGHSWSRHDSPAEMFRCMSCECRRYHGNAKAA
jgi:hypothetical protein